MTEAEVVNEVRTYIAQDILNGQDQGLDEKTPLLEWGILESLSLAKLITFLEGRFGITVSDADREPGNFVTLGAIAQLVLRQST